MELDLRRLFPLDSYDELEQFIGRRLHEAEVWTSPRVSDGITHVRIVEQEVGRVRIGGLLYTIDQKLHAFWLDLAHVERDVEWALFYDCPTTDAVDLHDSALDIEWATRRSGRARPVGVWQLTPVLELDGTVIDSLETFYEEVSRKLIPGAEWGRNLDAFNDILRGGFGTPPGGFVLRWLESSRSKTALAHPETAKYLERKLQRCHPSNVASVEKELKVCLRGEGPTLFDILLEIIRDHGEGGAESEDGVELELA